MISYDRNRYGVILFLILSVVLLSAGLLSQASAVESTSSNKGISISPPLKDITITTGLIQAKTDVTVTNNSDKDLSADLRVVDFKALDEFGGVSLGQAGVPLAKYGLANWISLPGGNNVLLPKGQAATIRVNIDNRSDLAPGGHYGAVVVAASTADSGAGNKVNLKQQLVSLIFLKKLGGEKYGLLLESIKTKAEGNMPSLASLRFKSTGNVHVVPRGYVLVTNATGRVVAKGIINPESTLVMPGNSRQFETLFQPVGSSSAEGNYKITAYYRYDGKTGFDSKSVVFERSSLTGIIFLLIGLTGVISLIIIGVISWRRKTSRNNRHLY